MNSYQPFRVNPIKLSVLALLLLTGSSLSGTALAQNAARPETVTWTLDPQTAAKPGSRVTLTLKGNVLPGWHVYALKQLPDGPTPLFVALGANTVAKADGPAIGSAPRKVRDAAFGLDTQFYADAFTVTLPVRLKPRLGPGEQHIPVRVRFQTCNGAVCQPPRTVQLSATVTLQAER